MNRNFFRLSSLLGVLFLYCTSASAQQPTDNPIDAQITYSWIDDNGVSVSDVRLVKANKPVGQWVPQLNNWNNRNTSAGNKIWNLDTTGLAWGFIDKLGRTVTQAGSDAFWDKFYMIQGNTMTPKGTYKRRAGSNSGWDQNCYGFATGKGYVILAQGWAVIAQDEYTIYQDSWCSKNCILKLLFQDHCVLLTDCCPMCKPKKNTIKTTSEKNGTSGIYDGTWDCAQGGLIVSLGTIHCKKK